MGLKEAQEAANAGLVRILETPKPEFLVKKEAVKEQPKEVVRKEDGIN